MKIFMSYAREDVEFVDRLSGALVRRGFEVLIDRKDIDALDDWRARLNSLLVKADAVVFVLSPDWLASSMCAWELERSIRRGKRLAPVLAREPSAVVPDALSKLQYAVFSAGQDLDVQAGVLATALNSDSSWSQAHTRYQDLADRWQELKRPDDHCISGGELRDAKRWLRNRPSAGASVTQLQREFLTRSTYINGWTYKALQSITLATIKAGDQAAISIGRAAGEGVKYLFRALLFVVWAVVRAVIYFFALLRVPYWRWAPLSVVLAIAAGYAWTPVADTVISAASRAGLIQLERQPWDLIGYTTGSVVTARFTRMAVDGAIEVVLDRGGDGIIPLASIARAVGPIGPDSKAFPVRILGPDGYHKRFLVEPVS